MDCVAIRESVSPIDPALLRCRGAVPTERRELAHGHAREWQAAWIGREDTDPAIRAKSRRRKTTTGRLFVERHRPCGLLEGQLGRSRFPWASRSFYDAVDLRYTFL